MINKVLIIINCFMWKKEHSDNIIEKDMDILDKENASSKDDNQANIPGKLIDNLKNNELLPDENKRLILNIVWKENISEEVLKELINKTKDELKRLKEDKDFILEVIWKTSISIQNLIELVEVIRKDYKKFIFDLDYTLLIPDWSCEDIYFKEKIIPEQQESFFEKKQDILNEYEIKFPKYDPKTLSNYFREYGFNVSEEVIQGRMEYNWDNIKDEVVDGVIEFLKYLRERGKKIVILTSRFSKTQIPRLERTGLIRYIDEVVAGDDAMKPDIESFKLAIGEMDKRDCLMIGDSLKSDKVGANNAEINCCIVGKGCSIRNLFDIIRKSEELRNKEE